MQKRLIAIVGTRGIPNRYGGFEQCAEKLSVGLVELGYRVIVYNTHNHPWREAEFHGVEIVRKWCPESLFGGFAHIHYDRICLGDALRRKADAVLEMGYQSAALSLLLYNPGRTRIIANMDGMEWQRQKWSRAQQRFIRWAEGVMVRRSHLLVADNPGIADYLQATYGRTSTMIPYGAEPFSQVQPELLAAYGLQPQQYWLLIARMEPENNIEMVLEGYRQSNSPLPFVVVGNCTHGYGRQLRQRYGSDAIRFVGAIFNTPILNNLRHHARACFHGHSVGGTNPALLEAMAAGALVVAHDNIFNRSVLQEHAFYFASAAEVAARIDAGEQLDGVRAAYADAGQQRIAEHYRWDSIVRQYADLIELACAECG